ncbi:MAG: carboxypeptidase regulatory-like domain-containing protein [Vicinamibacterales bacterium]
MQRFYLLTGSAIALALAGLLGACDGGPTRPMRQGGPQNVPVAIVDLSIAGPNTIPPGETAQFTATARQSDSSTRNVTNEVAWRTGNQSVLTISSTGLATGRDRGESSIQASLGGRTAIKDDVIVVPAGTYRLIGTLRESGFLVSGARVEVTAGTGQGLAVTANGGYRLYGVAGDIEVRVTADGYQEQRKRLQVTSHQTLDFDLILSRPRPDVSGTYTLTVTAAPECRAALPAETGIRTYTAVVGQGGPRLTVTLEGSRFFVDRGRTFNRFGGTVEPSGATFYVTGPDDFYYSSYGLDVVELLTDTTFFAFSGSAATTVSSAGLSGTLTGPIETLQSTTTPGRFERIASCRSTGHQFVLSR